MNLNQAREYALRMLKEALPTHLTYHEYRHTVEDVVPAARYYGELTGLDETDQCLLETAALYHDLGFMRQCQGHEEVGAQLVAEVLPAMGYRPDDILQIQEMIRATRLPQAPKTLLAAILCDADLDLLGRDDFMMCNQLLRQELAACGRSVSDAQWFSSQWAFVHDHGYQTSLARERRDAGKKRNLQLLFDRVRALHDEAGVR